MNTSEKTDKIIPALFAVKKEMKALVKTSDNPFFKSKYADLNTTLEAIEPLLLENDIIVLQPGTGEFLETVLMHISGQFITSSMILVIAKGTMQDAGSAVTYARRYTLQSLLGMKALDDDANIASGKSTPTKKYTPKATTSKAEPKTAAKKKASFTPDIKKETKTTGATGAWS